MKIKIKLLILMLFVIIAAKEPSIKYKKGIVYKDGTEYFKAEWDKILDAYEFRNLKDTAFMILSTRSYIDRDKISKANPTGNVGYSEAKLPGKDSIIFEMDHYPAKAKMNRLSQLFIKYKVIGENGSVNMTNLRKMGADIGSQHSRRRLELSR